MKSGGVLDCHEPKLNLPNKVVALWQFILISLVCVNIHLEKKCKENPY